MPSRAENRASGQNPGHVHIFVATGRNGYRRADASRQYFKRPFAQLDKGGYERLMHELVNRRIDERRLTTELPRTKALEKQALFTQNQHPEEAWLRDFLQRGRVPHGSHVDADGYAHTFTELLYQDYRDRLHKHDRVKSSIEFGNFLSKHLPRLRDVRPQVPKRLDGVQHQRRVLEPVPTCRRRYAGRGRAAPKRWLQPDEDKHWKVER